MNKTLGILFNLRNFVLHNLKLMEYWHLAYFKQRVFLGLLSSSIGGGLTEGLRRMEEYV